MSVTRPRGPLPARVYWTRRLVVLGLACALVFGIGRLLDGVPLSSPRPSARPAAAVASGETSTTPSPTAVATADATSSAQKPSDTGKGGDKPVREPLAMPTGPCEDSDVRVQPWLEEDPYAGGEVPLALRLTTYEAPACTWEVDAESIVVKLTSGSDRIWSTQECPGAVPTESVVLRQERKPVLLDVMWSGRRSDPDCSRTTLWAEPGYYHLASAAMGSEPETQQFELRPPAPVTVTPKPNPKKRDGASREEQEPARERSGNRRG